MRTDEEQVEDLKKWWRKYSGSITIGLVIGLGAVFGSRAWVDYQERQRLAASAEYEQFQVEFAQKNVEALLRRGDYLIENYARTPYAVLAALALAKIHVERDDLPAARQRLQWVMDKAKGPELIHVARLRLARVLAAEGQAAQALTLLDSVDPGAFAASYAELKGDLYAETGAADKARAAYLTAISELGFGAGSEFVQMKLDDLGTDG